MLVAAERFLGANKPRFYSWFGHRAALFEASHTFSGLFRTGVLWGWVWGLLSFTTCLYRTSCRRVLILAEVFINSWKAAQESLTAFVLPECRTFLGTVVKYGKPNIMPHLDCVEALYCSLGSPALEEAKDTVGEKSDRPLWNFHANLNRNCGAENSTTSLQFGFWSGWYSTFLERRGCVQREGRNVGIWFTFYRYIYTSVCMNRSLQLWIRLLSHLQTWEDFLAWSTSLCLTGWFLKKWLFKMLLFASHNFWAD